MKTQFLYLVVGESGSGKTTVLDVLEKRYNYTQVQSYTTRPQRQPDETGHIFVSEEEYKSIEDKVAFTIYDGYKYCATKQQLDNANFYVVDADGMYNLMSSELFDRDFRIIYLTAPLSVRTRRMKERGDIERDIVRRIETEKFLTDKYMWNADICIQNINIEETLLKIIDFIKECETYKKDLIYISHPFKNNPENQEEINKIVYNNTINFPEYVFVSPVNTYGHMYDKISYEQGLACCIELLKYCSQCWVYGDYNSSVGCKAEIEYCKRYNIPVHFIDTKEIVDEESC